MPRTKIFQEALLAALLLAVAFLWTYRIAEVMDIDPWDEPESYLRMGFQFWRTHELPTFDWGPLYTLWYAGLSLFEKDPLSAYFLSAALIVAGLAAAFYAFVRLMGAGALAGSLAAVFLLIHPPLMTINRRTSQFALFLILSGWAAAALVKGRPLRWCALSLVLVAGSWARPEYLAAALPALAYSALLWVREGKHLTARRRYAALALWLAAAGGISLAAHTISSYKPIYVFKNYNARRLKAQEPRLQFLTDRQVFEKFYGDASTVSGALLHNPPQFLRHVGYNLLETARTLLNLGKAYVVFLATPFFWLLILGAALAAGVFRRRWPPFLKLDPGPRVSREIYPMLALLVFPGLLSVLTYGVIPQYLIGILTASIVLLSACGRLDSRPLAIAFAALFAGAALWFPVNFREHPELKPVWTNFGDDRQLQRFFNQEGLKAVRACRELAARHPIRLLSVNFPIAPYFHPEIASLNICWNEYEGCPEGPGVERIPFSEFLRRDGWNMVYVYKERVPDLDKLLKAGPFRKEFLSFLSSPQKFGFRELEVEGISDRILVRSDILSSP